MLPKEAATIIGCSKSQVCVLIRQGKIKARKKTTEFSSMGYVWDIPPSEVRRITKQRTTNKRKAG